MERNGRYIEVNEQQLYMECHIMEENRPVIVFLHDSLGCVQTWRDFPHKLATATQCNALLYDRLGYGKSEALPTHERPKNYLELEADALIGLLNKLGLHNVILFGHSDGASIALLAAAKYPDRIKALVVEAAHIFVEDITLRGLYDVMQTHTSVNLFERLEKYHGNKVETLFRAWTETWTSDSYRDWNMESWLKNIVSPLLFIQGENDEYGSLEQVEKTISQVHGIAEKYIIPHVGHTPHKEVPDDVLQRTTRFINQVT